MIERVMVGWRMDEEDVYVRVETYWWRMVKVEEIYVDGDETDGKDGRDEMVVEGRERNEE